ncbi:S41 family peptidase [Bacillus solimangrovi]|uniref:C-terminal processing peptidase n=1 Tax=Bacillus solimangrovi TaxID=1305675 RepID=A0A1E5LDR3_9BACI|nr:S41 family peptidase [Bacillus solimangrovi]OEH92216.1 peptidase S41 [Bacillus solimangrovi]
MNFRGRVVAILMGLSLVMGAGVTYLFANVGTEELPIYAMEEQTAPSTSGTSTNNEAEIDKISRAMQVISESYVEKVDEEKLVEGAIQGMLETLDDPYSVYMNKETAKQFTDSLDSSFEGIGAEVSMIDGKVTIVSPYKGSPAEKAGLKPNDQIITVDGNSLEGLDLYEAVLKIRGKKGSIVKLEVQRPGVAKPLIVDVTRDEIPIETVYSSVKDVNGEKIGYIEVTSFSEDTAQHFEEGVAELEKQNITGLVIDVRGNPGGYLQSVEQMLKQFITKEKPYLQIENREGEKKRFFSSLKEKKDYPISVLIDGGSASASEILAGAMKEAGGYDIVGVKSFGKGTVQQAMPMEDGSNLKLTLFKWLTPEGNWIHEKGVEPTVIVEQPEYFHASPIEVEEPLKLDQTSEQIKNAQIMLRGLGFEPGRTDGYFGAETDVAVKAFQRTNELSVTGEIDEQTAGKMQQQIIELIRSEENDIQLEVALKLVQQK